MKRYNSAGPLSNRERIGGEGKGERLRRGEARCGVFCRRAGVGIGRDWELWVQGVAAELCDSRTSFGEARCRREMFPFARNIPPPRLGRHLFFPHREPCPRAESPAKAVSLPKHFSRTRYSLQAACGQPSVVRVLRGGSRSRVPITEAFPESRTGWDATSGRYLKGRGAPGGWKGVQEGKRSFP